MAERLRRSQDDHDPARPPHAPLRHCRDRQRKLALQKPRLTSRKIRAAPTRDRSGCATQPAPPGRSLPSQHVSTRGPFSVKIWGPVSAIIDTLLASAPFARARTQALQNPSLLLQSVARQRLRAVELSRPRRRRSSATSAPRRSISRAWAAIRASTSGGRLIPPLSQNPPPCLEQSQPRNQSSEPCDFSDSPQLGSC
jgi:hypothetical protein